MERISIIGTTGSGKSTLGKQLADALSMPCIELDAINWQMPDWSEIGTDRLQAEVSQVIQQGRWIIEGGYSNVRPMIWARADTVVWLDYSFAVTFSRLLRRTMRRIVRKEILWGGNRETLARTLSRDSILLWCINTHGRRRRQFPELLARPEHQHLRLIRMKTPRQTRFWLAELNRIKSLH